MDILTHDIMKGVGMEVVREPLVNSELLEKYIANSGLKTSFICTQLGISRQAFDKKRKGRFAFRGAEMYVLCDLLRISDSDKQKIFYPNATPINDEEE